MAHRNLPPSPTRRAIGKREVNTRRSRPRILIVCEGERTEPNYFEGFRATNAIVVGTGYNTLRLVREAVRLKVDYGLQRADQVWAVFDRDAFPADQIRQAFVVAKKHGIHIAYSNQAFELWYVLHFAYLDAALDRIQLAERLTRYLGHRYEKNALDLFETLLARQPDALHNAKRLIDYWHSFDPLANDFDPLANDPVTTIPDLVEELNKWTR